MFWQIQESTNDNYTDIKFYGIFNIDYEDSELITGRKMTINYMPDAMFAVAASLLFQYAGFLINANIRSYHCPCRWVTMRWSVSPSLGCFCTRRAPRTASRRSWPPTCRSSTSTRRDTTLRRNFSIDSSSSRNRASRRRERRFYRRVKYDDASSVGGGG